ncbi:MAG TPA: helix-turn-helix domain-containing protein [Acidimicrobiales bacterium]|nr:helix-turn-helix domain-containing protein [Acidimicrobiales bacterium]
MTRPYNFQKWATPRIWPGGGWGEAIARVRKDQHLTQKGIADYIDVPLAEVRRWETGVALPDRSLWPRLEEAMGMPVPDPRVPDHTPAERELIDTMLLLIDEVRLLRERIGETRKSSEAPASAGEPRVLNIAGAAEHLGLSVSLVRRLVSERRIVHYKLGNRVMFRTSDLERFIDDNKRDSADRTVWQLRTRRQSSPRRRPDARR